jgi:opacity protein-like surface antigen
MRILRPSPWVGGPVVIGLLLTVCCSGAQAQNTFGAYLGAAVGQGQVAASIPYASLVVPNAETFRHSDTAYDLMLGVRAVSLLGAELQYLNLGHPQGDFYGYPADASVKGAAAFGVLYFPVPVPMIDFYAKAGAARLQSEVSGFFPSGGTALVCVAGAPCGTFPFHLDRTTTGFALGAGAQLRFGDWAIRAEYERFDAAGAYPSLAAVGFTWTFW